MGYLVGFLAYKELVTIARLLGDCDNAINYLFNLVSTTK